MNVKAEVLAHLLALRDALPYLEDGYDYHPYRYEIGICYNVLNNLDPDLPDEGGVHRATFAYELIKRAIRSWPKCLRDQFGDLDTTFPVDDGKLGYYGAGAMAELYRNPLRIQLLEHLIKEFSDV